MLLKQCIFLDIFLKIIHDYIDIDFSKGGLPPEAIYTAYENHFVQFIILETLLHLSYGGRREVKDHASKEKESSKEKEIIGIASFASTN